MKAFLCLIAITALVGLLYVYMRQQLQNVNTQIEQLRELTKAMALELRDDRDREPVAEIAAPSTPIAPRLYVVSDDSESEDDTDDESDESDDESLEEIPVKVEEVKSEPKVEPKSEPKIEPNPEIKSVMVENLDFRVEELDPKVEDLILDITEDAKVINVDMSAKLDSYSVKELKDMVAAKGGPASLKTKKAMIEFLEKIK